MLVIAQVATDIVDFSVSIANSTLYSLFVVLCFWCLDLANGVALDAAVDIFKLRDVAHVFCKEMLKLLLYFLDIFAVDFGLVVHFSVF